MSHLFLAHIYYNYYLLQEFIFLNKTQLLIKFYLF
jgi:hypothetical protein